MSALGLVVDNPRATARPSRSAACPVRRLARPAVLVPGAPGARPRARRCA